MRSSSTSTVTHRESTVRLLSRRPGHWQGPPLRSADVEDLERERARWGDDGDLVTHPLADQRAANGRFIRDEPAPRVGFVRANEVVGLFLPFGIDHLDV